MLFVIENRDKVVSRMSENSPVETVPILTVCADERENLVFELQSKLSLG